jgi:O-antigen ligase
LWLFVWAYVIGASILVWMALFVFNLSVGLNGVARLDNLETWDANDLCVLLLIGLGLSLLLFQTTGRWGKAALATIIVGIGAAIARSGSRGGFIGLAAVVLAYLLSMQGTSVVRRLGLVAVLAVGMAVAAPAGYWQQMNTISSVKSDYNWDAAQGRRQLAIRGLKYMMDYPFFGLGASNFGRADAALSDFAKRQTERGVGVKWSAVHNSYVEAGSEMGIPGLLLFSSLAIGSIVSPWMLRRRIPQEWARGVWDERFLFHAARYFPIAAVGFAVSAFFVSFAFLEPVYVLAGMTAALSAFVHARLKGIVPPDPPRRATRGWRTVSPHSFI